ncbi:helix-turn-helix domain-containing protein [Nocardia cyriacigeorgica]|uniref:Helix-turn-helix domain-containing protein n=1 Tax=Nocardia cyriacigeorgica TaxID=135487 RepID=A0A6P1D5V3_9NOCA|nr:helix-turn-helix transcriptional regulator [Nocardia cyriacigeorgica]NEW41992.1 helix-turn-helix domain-containing protein [Nocardia cyriacigeorgica]NEW44774.1 helix-turn-helix domain-containing protein [Nocardia cyriacigeorgica]NEW50480.1 helix-turn-helix domain-containing protein [Nocardia cyriacigeorgica]NEW59347.1 helix-turn-helix domain-containing protein [Nocardia cyriacigeorgica]
MRQGNQGSPVGALLRQWRHRRRLSQLELALAADSSARHISYLETGRSQPSRAMVLKLCEALDVPSRERNTVLLAGGFTPEHRDSPLDEAELASTRIAWETMLAAHEPYPAVLVDRYWNVITANRGMKLFETAIADEVAAEPSNVYRIALYPEGPASPARMVNYRQVRKYLLERLIGQVRATGDPALQDLYDEVSHYPLPAEPDEIIDEVTPSPFSIPVRIRTAAGELRMFSTTMTFGAPSDVTLAELAIELFYPLDGSTAAILHELARAGGFPVGDGAR